MQKFPKLVFSATRYIIIIPYFIGIFVTVDLQKYEITFSALLIVLATLVSFSQTCFAYEAGIKDGVLKETLLYTAKKFFVSSIWLGIGSVVLFLYLIFVSNIFTEQWYMYVIKYAFLLVALFNFVYFAINLNDALKKAEHILF